MRISEVNRGARCEVCGAEATWEAGNPGQAAKGPRYRQRFLCGPDSVVWGRFFDRRHSYVRSGTRINLLRWQEVFNEFVAAARYLGDSRFDQPLLHPLAKEEKGQEAVG